MVREPRSPQEIIVRPLRETDLTTAESIRRIAFGTFLGVADLTTFRSDTDYLRTRWLADPNAAFGAELGGELVGSNLATRWGSVGFFGPLTVHPDLWNRGIATRLMEPVMELFANLGNHTGGSVHLCRQSGTHSSVSEIRVLATVPDRDHVEGGLSTSSSGVLVAVFSTARQRAEAISGCLP